MNQEEKINEIEDKLNFLKDVLSKYTFPNGQLESLYLDWKKKEGIFRINN